jgi:hypothetical protein
MQLTEREEKLLLRALDAASLQISQPVRAIARFDLPAV